MHVNIHFCVKVNPYVKETKVEYRCIKSITWNIPKSDMLRTKERYLNWNTYIVFYIPAYVKLKFISNFASVNIFLLIENNPAHFC